MSVEIIETQTSRENKLIALVAAVFPDLEFMEFISEWRYSSDASYSGRLGFSKRKPFWVSLFCADRHTTWPAITITGRGGRPLDLDAGWTHMSIHVFKADLLQKATHLATKITVTTGKSANIIQEV